MAGSAFLKAVQGVINTSTGNQDFTVSGMGTPKGAIVIIGGSTSDGANTDNLSFGIGFFDGTNSTCVGIASQDALADGDTARCLETVGSSLIHIPNYAASGTLVEGRGISWVTDGIRINFVTVDGLARYVTIIFICGDDAQCKVGTFDMSDHTGSPNQTLDVTGQGFDPNLAFFLSCVGIGVPPASGITGSASYSFGIGCLDGSGNVNTIISAFAHRDTRPTGQPSFYSGSTNQGDISTGFAGAASGALTKVGPVNLDSFITDGFRVKDVPGANPPPVGYMAVRLNGCGLKALTFDADPANSSETISVGILPGAAIIMSTSADAAGDKTDTRATGVGYGVALLDGSQMSHAFWEEDAVATMNNGSISSIDTPILTPTESGGTGLEYQVSFGSSTVTFTKSQNTYGSASKQYVLFIQRQTFNIFPTGIASAEAFGTATVTPGSRTVSPSSFVGWDNALDANQGVGSPTITPGSVTISPSGIASAEAFGTPTLTVGSVTVSPSGIASDEAFGTATVTPGSVTISPSGIASAEAFGTPTLSVADVTISPSGIASAEAFGTPTVSDDVVTVLVTGIASAEAFGTPTLSVADVTISPSGISSEEAFGTPTLINAVIILPTGIASEEAFGILTITAGDVTLFIAGITSEEAFGTPSLNQTSTVVVSPSGIASAEAFGFPFIQGGFIPVTLKKKIRDAIVQAAKLGTFIEATYDKDLNEILQGLQVAPTSIEANEITTRFKIEDAFGRAFVQDRQFWSWMLVLRFDREVIAEPFERALEDTPICIKRTAGEDRQVHVLLVDAQYTHPPRQGASNGTEARYRFQAELSRR